MDIKYYINDNGAHLVSERLFYKFATRAKQLVLDQRKALRTGDKKLIQDCKKRERALLDWVTVYEKERAQLIQDLK